MSTSAIFMHKWRTRYNRNANMDGVSYPRGEDSHTWPDGDAHRNF